MQHTPLATLLRPTTLDEYWGQETIVGDNQPLRVMLEMGSISSLVLWGPPGTGKTTLAKIIARTADLPFIELSATTASKKDVLATVQEAQPSLLTEQSNPQPPLVFIDEIHRFSKSQQDTLLPLIETGKIILIGATTENPSFELNPALLSRVQVVTLSLLHKEALRKILEKAEKELTLQKKINQAIPDEVGEWLIEYSMGDARRLLTILDLATQSNQSLSIEGLKGVASNSNYYDKKGEYHYDIISAFIKSMRASNPDAALYYLARMVDAGEDPKFIARRMIIFASEDIGLAQPTALVVANAVFDAVSKIGYPEAQINLAHGVAYLALAKKDRSAYDAYFSALDDVKNLGHLPVPMKLRNAPTKLMKDLGYGKEYQMYPDPSESLLPEKIDKKRYLGKKD